MAATTQHQNSKVTPHVQQHLQLHQQHMTHQSQGDTGALHNDYAEHAVVEDRLYAQPPVGRQAIMERSRELHTLVLIFPTEVAGDLMNTLRQLRSLVKPLAYAHRLFIVPLAAFLPAPLAYWLARLRGDWHYRRDCVGRETIMRNLAGVLGERLSPTERARVTRDYFRLRSCEPVDVVRLAGKGRGLARLVEIRGREHLEAALAQGKGAILCGAHFGSSDASVSLIGIGGFPITAVGRWTSISDPTLPPWVRLFRQWIQERCVASHWRRPLIQPHPGQWKTAVQMATVLRANEVIAMAIDPPSLAADRPRAVPVPFLGGQAMLLPGSVTIARLTGAPVLMLFLRRSADWRHQVLEISPPIPMDGDVVTAFARCVAAVEAAILRDPAHWIYWSRSDDLVDLGLLFATDETATATALAGVQVAREKQFGRSL